MTDSDTLLFLPDYSDRLTRPLIDSERGLSSTDGHGQPAASDECPSEDVGDEHALTPASSTLHSPAEDQRVDERPPGSRPHASSTTKNGHSRQIVGQRGRPSWNTGQPSSLTIPRSPQDIPPEMALGMGRFECNIDATMQDAMIAEPQGAIRQAHVHNPMNYGIGQQLAAGIPMVPDAFDQNINASAHEGVLVDHHVMPHDMMHGISHSLPVQDDLGYQPWVAMLDSNISPGPSHSMFGLHPQMQMQAQGPSAHSYFEASPTELGAGMTRGLPLMNPSAPYQVVSHGPNRTLPVRVMSESHVQMLPLAEEDSKDAGGPYYHI